jgi:hypothetical protein
MGFSVRFRWRWRLGCCRGSMFCLLKRECDLRLCVPAFFHLRHPGLSLLCFARSLTLSPDQLIWEQAEINLQKPLTLYERPYTISLLKKYVGMIQFQ